MKIFQIIGITACLLTGISSYAQKIISEGTLSYNIVIETGAKEPQMSDVLDGATSIVYIKGGLSRTDMVSALGSESTLYDTKTGEAIILKAYSGQKLMISLTKDDWISKNKKYQGVQYTFQDETKTIAGYECKKAIAKLADGNTITVFYSTGFNLMNKEYEQLFKNLPGIPMQYEFIKGKMKFSYTLSKMDLSPLLNSKFEAPKTGFRVITYQETLKTKSAQ
jgi:GLPGLI family protein